MLRYVSPLAPLARGEVINLSRSDVAPLHTRLKDRIGYRLQRPTNVCASTGSLPLVQKSFARICHCQLLVLVLFSLQNSGGQALHSRGLICRAMAQIKPLSSRASAVMTTGIFLRPTPESCL